jgi:hypothetical protein
MSLGYQALYLVIVVLAVAGLHVAWPRLEQIFGRALVRLRKARPMPMTKWSNDVEETNLAALSLHMQLAEIDIHWAWLMDNAPIEYRDALIMGWARIHQAEPALLAHAKKLGRYKPEFGFKAMAGCLDESPQTQGLCPYRAGQVAIPPPDPAVRLPLPPRVPSVSVPRPSGPLPAPLPADPAGPVTVPSAPSSAVQSGPKRAFTMAWSDNGFGPKKIADRPS